MSRFSLQFRLMVVVAGLFVAILGVAVVWVVTDAREAVANEVSASLEIATQLVDLLAESSEQPGPMPGSAAERLRRLRSTRHLRIEVLDTEAVPPVPRVPANPDEIAVPGWFVRLVHPEMRTVAMPTVPGGRGRVFLTTDPADEIAETWQEARRLLLVLFVFSLAAGTFVLVVIRRALRPLEELNTAVEQIERGDYSARVRMSSPPEVDAVIGRFNRMAEALQATRARNEQLTARALEIREAERRTLARELHDEMGQSISAIRAVAVAVAEKAEPGSDLRVRADTIADIAEGVYASVRGMMHRLRPAILDELGLPRALEAMVDDWNGHHADAFCRLNVDPALPDVPEPFAINLYRIVQEALTNVAKHAEGATVSVGLECAGERRVLLDIADDGGGFFPDDVPVGLGLTGIRERAEAIGAALTIDPGPGRGVRIVLTVDLTYNNPDE